MIRQWAAFLYIRLLGLYHLPLASLLPLETLRNALNTFGYPAVAVFIMIESTGIPFPGETMLLFASFYAAIDHKLQIPIVIACAALGAIIGDNFGYTIGRTGGHAFVRRFGRYLFLKPAHLERAERFFQKHGDKTVFFGRFIAVLRAWAAFLAGVNRMHWLNFLIYNAAGGILWAIIYGCLGFYAGRLFHDNFGAVEHLASTISWVGAALIVAAIIAAYIIFRLRHHRQHETDAHDEENTEKGSPKSMSATDGTQAGPEQEHTEEGLPEIARPDNGAHVPGDQQKTVAEEGQTNGTVSPFDASQKKIAQKQTPSSGPKDQR